MRRQKISEKFSELRKKDEGALICYIMAGDPTAEQTGEIVKALVNGGADIIELGFPFSDPVADGPTIQVAGQRALAAGMDTERYLLKP
jgi:tryptophan synthase alpha chain